MINKLKLLFLLLSLFFVGNIFANDGVYYTSGNQLIPISETDISVEKEVLSITKLTEIDEKYNVPVDYAFVTVDYTFFNAGEEKNVLVGFEAFSPVGDVYELPVNDKHPFIYNFDVLMNNQYLPYEIAIVDSENYYVNDTITKKTVKEISENSHFDSYNQDFYYVYHFKANFKKGKNKIVHTYKFDLSSSVMDAYNFDYKLTPALRWGNQQIDDFTLHINMGENESFNIQKTFFENEKDWIIDDGRVLLERSLYSETSSLNFITFTGGVTFRKKNFKPQDELYIYAKREVIGSYEYFNANFLIIPDTLKIQNTPYMCDGFISYKILRNLPYAKRGYIFKTKEIQQYYLKQAWYKPNKNYIADYNALSNEEKQWLEKLKEHNKFEE